MRKWFTLCSWPQWVSAGIGRLWEESRVPRDGWADCTDEQLRVSDATVQDGAAKSGVVTLDDGCQAVCSAVVTLGLA